MNIPSKSMKIEIQSIDLQMIEYYFYFLLNIAINFTQYNK